MQHLIFQVLHFQTVDKGPNRQNEVLHNFTHHIGYSLSNNGSYQIREQPKGLLRKHFDLLRNSHSTVLVYADECELLVFGAFLNSPSACRNSFSTR